MEWICCRKHGTHVFEETMFCTLVSPPDEQLMIILFPDLALISCLVLTPFPASDPRIVTSSCDRNFLSM